MGYDTTKYFVGFVHPVEFENAPELTQQLPTAKLMGLMLVMEETS